MKGKLEFLSVTSETQTLADAIVGVAIALGVVGLIVGGLATMVMSNIIKLPPKFTNSKYSKGLVRKIFFNQTLLFVASRIFVPVFSIFHNCWVSDHLYWK